jgi:hypothetical protein
VLPYFRSGGGGGPTAGFLLGPGGTTGAAKELVESVGEVGFVLIAVPALFDLGLDVAPEGVVEGLVDMIPVDPRDFV